MRWFKKKQREGVVKPKIKKGDSVVVISGSYRTEKPHKVIKVMKEEGRCIVEGINMKTLHKRPTSPEEPGGRIKKEGSISLSNIMLVCPRCNSPTRVGKKKISNRNVRVCKKCGEIIDE